jgi:hypothetical protein
MPHAFKPHAKHPAVPFLVRLHADIGGRLLENKRQAEKLAADAKAVEAVLKMFDPEFNARAISARRRVTGEAPCSVTRWTCSARPRCPCL